MSASMVGLTSPMLSAIQGAFHTPANKAPTVAHAPNNDETPVNTGVLKYRYRDSNPVRLCWAA